MVLAGDVWDEGSLGTRPSHDLVKKSLEAISGIDSELEWKIKAITTLPSPPGMNISLCKAAKAAMEAEAKRAAEAEKAQHRSVLQLEELYQMYDSIVKKSEKPDLSGTEVDIQGNMKLDLQQLRHELSKLILFDLPDSAQRLSTIAKLDLSNNNMKCLAESLTSLVNLRTLDVHSNQLTSLPHSMGRLKKLKTLNISGNFFAELPESVQNCSGLEELNADFNDLKQLPETLGVKLFNLQKLSVHSNKLTYLPCSISCLISLRVLDVHMNKLGCLPQDIGNLENLQILNISCNFHYLNALPDSICRLTRLDELDVSYNQIKTLPDLFGDLVMLTRLNLEGNPLVLPPPEITRDGMEAVKIYMRNRASKIIVPPIVSTRVYKSLVPPIVSMLGCKGLSSLGVVKTCIVNQASKILIPNNLSSLGCKLAAKSISSTSGTSAIMKSGKSMSLYQHIYGEERFSSKARSQLEAVKTHKKNMSNKSLLSCNFSSLGRKLAGKWISCNSGTSGIVTSRKSMTLYEHLYQKEGPSSKGCF